VHELRIVEDEFVKKGLVAELDGSLDGVFGDTERLRVCNPRFGIGCRNEDDFGDFSVLSFDSAGILLRGCLDKEDIRRLAAAIGPIDKHSVNELFLVSLEVVGSSLKDESSLLDILNKFI
jgi:hypothetical protein